MSENEKDPYIKIVATCDTCGLLTNRLSSNTDDLCPDCGLSRSEKRTSSDHDPQPHKAPPTNDTPEDPSTNEEKEKEAEDSGAFINLASPKKRERVEKTTLWLEKELPGRYQLKEILYKCADYVALKVFDPHLKKAFLLKVFKNPTDGGIESSDLALAELLAGLNHPHILPLYETGLTAGERLYLLMEDPGEKNLESVIKEDGFLDLPVGLELFIQAAEALHCFHQLNVSHGAIRPRSFIVQEETKDICIAKLTNYSITRFAEDNLEQPTKIGRNYTCIDAFYMSPEECNSLDSDLCSEIYSFGCVMFHAITGKPVFRARNLKEAIRQHIDETSARFRRQYEIPEDVQAVILKMLSKDRDSRYPSFEAVRKDLYALQSGRKPKEETFWDKIISKVKEEKNKRRF